MKSIFPWRRGATALALLFAVVLVGAGGCGGTGSLFAPVDGGPDLIEADGGGLPCPGGRARCGDECVDLTSDPRHCSACGQACALGDVCAGSSCVTPPDCNQTPCVGFTYCDSPTGRCLPGCDHDAQCAGGERCDTAAHACGCAAGTHRCGAVCASDSDPATCGQRCAPCPDDGNPCTDTACSAGQCGHTPNDARTCAGGACHAGACCTGCWDGSACQAGQSTAACGFAGGACAPCVFGAACMAGTCVQACAVATAGQPLVVDVRTALLTVDVTLDGQAVGAANTSDSDKGSVVLRDAVSGEEVFVFTVWSGGRLLPYAVRVVRGTYDLRYRKEAYTNVNGGGNWPVNDDKVLRKGVVVDRDMTLTVDVPTARLGVDVTLDGQPVAAANTSDSDKGQVVLRDPETGEAEVFRYTVWSGGRLLPFTTTVVKGTYELRYAKDAYRNVNGGGNWPVNDDKLLRKALVVNGNQSITVDVPTARLGLDVTLDGKVVGTANTSDSDKGQVVLRDPETGESEVFRYTVWSGGRLLPYTTTVVKGTYELRYAKDAYLNVNGGGNWPVNDDKVLQKGLVVSGNQSLTVDVTTARLGLDVTLDGQAVAAANTSDSDKGQVVLRDAETGESEVFRYTVWSAGRLLPYAATVVKGTYELRYAKDAYRNVNGGGNWPVNDDKVLQKGLVVSGNQTVTADVPTARLGLDVTLDGQALGTANTSDSDKGQVVLRDPETGESEVFRYTVWSAGRLLPYTATVVKGSYEFRYAKDVYHNVNGGGNWPVNDDRVLRNGVVVNASQSLTVDVPTARLGLDVTLDGQVVAPANTSESDKGLVVLRGPDTGESEVFRYSVWSGGRLLPYVATVVKGNYEVRYARDVYRNVNGGGNWAVNDDAPLACVNAP